jgi:hypothetical protein
LAKQRRLRASQVKIRDLEQSRDRWKRRALEAEKALAGARDAPEYRNGQVFPFALLASKNRNG